jgi:hypothetical protein|tara:strand:+ start:7421 stop:7570 length:150 start_codon:yes stop_codon:yes gene_type:complete
MKEIDEMLNRWIQNSNIRKELRDLIIKEINRNEGGTLTGALSQDTGPRS